MERLTDKQSRNPVCSAQGGLCVTAEFVRRLAAYEDTGLEPKEVEQIKLALMGKALAKIKELEGISIVRMIDLAQAEQDGRLVVLPCKPGETAYQWKKGDDIPSLFRFDGVNINEDGEITYQTHWGETFTPDDFGKTVFLTREESLAALKERGGKQ